MSRYEIRVQGALSETARTALGDLRLRALPTETALVGTVIDDAELRGILDLIADLGLHLVAMQELRE
ncbi:MAG TPA: hypothetical protein VFP34_13770 [Microlunatus sp.]|nr:hypothetical protein [Microlunatus sp.]